eukprot:GHVP01006062.1.p1 GENE.GHVP01006062.1~~GHVP01006062.1.p1  ORF type:complete len:1098 (+),score=203.02 GHVP01006062.1:316-3294(+)
MEKITEKIISIDNGVIETHDDIETLYGFYIEAKDCLELSRSTLLLKCITVFEELEETSIRNELRSKKNSVSVNKLGELENSIRRARFGETRLLSLYEEALNCGFITVDQKRDIKNKEINKRSYQTFNSDSDAVSFINMCHTEFEKSKIAEKVILEITDYPYSSDGSVKDIEDTLNLFPCTKTVISLKTYLLENSSSCPFDENESLSNDISSLIIVSLIRISKCISHHEDCQNLKRNLDLAKNKILLTENRYRVSLLNEKTEIEYQQALIAYNEGNYNSAIEILSDKTSFISLRILQKAYLETSLEKAIEVSVLLVKEENATKEDLLVHAYCLYKKDRNYDALGTIEKVFQVYPNDLYALHLKNTILTITEAPSDFNLSSFIKSDVLSRRGIILCKQGDYKEAEECLLTALNNRTPPENDFERILDKFFYVRINDIGICLAKIYLFQMKYREAHEMLMLLEKDGSDYDNSLDLDRSFDRDNIGLATDNTNLAKVNNNLTRDNTNFAKDPVLSTNSSTGTNLSTTTNLTPNLTKKINEKHSELNKIPESSSNKVKNDTRIPKFDKSTNIQSNGIERDYLLGRIYHYLRNPTKSIHFTASYIRRNEKDSEALFFLGTKYFEIGNIGSALKTFNRAYIISQETNQLYSLASLIYMAKCARLDGKLEDSLKYIRRAEEIEYKNRSSVNESILCSIEGIKCRLSSIKQNHHIKENILETCNHIIESHKRFIQRKEVGSIQRNDMENILFSASIELSTFIITYFLRYKSEGPALFDIYANLFQTFFPNETEISPSELKTSYILRTFLRSLFVNKEWKSKNVEKILKCIEIIAIASSSLLLSNILEEIEKFIPDLITEHIKKKQEGVHLVGRIYMYLSIHLPSHKKRSLHFLIGALDKEETSEVWTSLGIYYYLQGEVDKAKYSFNEALKLNSENSLIWLGLSFIDNGTHDNLTEKYLESRKLLMQAILVSAIKSPLLIEKYSYFDGDSEELIQKICEYF